MLLYLVASSLVCAVGCGKSQHSEPVVEHSQPADPQDAPVSSSVPGTVPPTAPEPPPAPEAPVAPVAPVNGIVDPALTAQLRIFIDQQGRLPTSFAELAGARLDSVPRLQKGLAFAIDLATREVKIVRQ